MRSTRNILLKTLVRTFYVQHVGLLLFVFYLFFGVVNGTELLHYHLSLIRAVLDSWVLLLIVIAIWFLYAGKALHFLRAQIMKEEMSFLILFENLASQEKKIQLFFVQAMIMLPVTVYGMLIATIGWHENKIIQSIIVLISLLMSVLVPLYILQLTLNRTERKFEWLQIRWRFSERIQFVYARYIFRYLNFGLAVSKILSLLLMFGLLTGFGIDHYDVRLPLLAMLIAVATHSMIVFNVQQFEVHMLPFVKQLPVSVFKRVFPLISTYFFLLLPEYVLLLRVYLPAEHLADLPVIILFGTLWLAALHAICYYSDAERDRFQLVIFFFVSLCFFFLIFHLQWLLMAGLAGLILVGMNRWYFLFEQQFD